MEAELTRYEALIACRDAAGSDSQMARDLGVTQPRVWRWVNQSKQMPPEYVLPAETKYGIARHQLRPDIYPVPISAEDGVLSLGRPAEDLPAPTAPVACDLQDDSQAKDAA